MTISVITPILNEAGNLPTLLCTLRDYCSSAELIIVDGGSEDDSVRIAKNLADRVVISSPGRAIQMNAGAAIARGDVLWFVHADSTVSASLAPAIESAFRNPAVVGGCFRLRLASPKKIYRVRDAIGNLLVDATGIALGDRGFFCRKSTFIEIGGYPEIQILEDAEFYRTMRRRGRVIQLDEAIGSSVRRYEALGAAPTILFYGLVMLL